LAGYSRRTSRKGMGSWGPLKSRERTKLEALLKRLKKQKKKKKITTKKKDKGWFQTEMESGEELLKRLGNGDRKTTGDCP